MPMASSTEPEHLLQRFYMAKLSEADATPLGKIQYAFMGNAQPISR